MKIDDAVKKLCEHLSYPWIVSIGIGRFAESDAIFVYVNSNRAMRNSELANLHKGWMGFPVVIRKSGKVVAA